MEDFVENRVFRKVFYVWSVCKVFLPKNSSYIFAPFGNILRRLMKLFQIPHESSFHSRSYARFLSISALKDHTPFPFPKNP